ncbi:secretion protein HlyD family protein [Novosphingobium sp. Rr 2-17]|uniref:HlyD family secretion protein n=1 Tax=Novosphingobium sp. Rr 2-17 TaxID=555793 RepID=UPI0002699BE9|nr:HlyD family secretion protein [Novosphingobium sp. Rr 2-17]EIZ77960.1 secretion protein HlyD family protein [Novosphingobium sp. Rr 2-17]
MNVEARSEQIAAGRLPEAGDGPGGGSGASDAAAERRISSRTLLVSGLAIAAAIAGVVWITATPTSESTDDAYVAADATTVAPKVRGLVESVLVRDNQHVRAGDPLVRIDSEEFDAKVDSAAADVADAEADIAAARAALVSLDAEQRLASANVVATRTAIRSAGAEADRADADRRRYDALVASGAVALRDADTYRAAAITAQQSSARAHAMLAVSERESGVTAAKRAILLASLQKAQAAHLRAVASLNLARQDNKHTLIRAAIDGVVGNRQVRVGDYVQPGSRLLTLVPLGAVYVTANFKETQTRHMREGQPVAVEVDALDGPALKGRVDSLAPGSGSTFSLLPFEPGTGNFTKIVQRVPVRIRFEPGQPRVAELWPGLSVTTKVGLSH